MNDIKRWKRIVAVRSTQRDISAMRLMEAKQRTRVAGQRLEEAQQQLADAALPGPIGVALSRSDLERLDAMRTAAWEEITEWQAQKQTAEHAQESARSQVEAQHLLLRQSERMGERVERREKRRLSAAEQWQADEQASRRRS